MLFFRKKNLPKSQVLSVRCRVFSVSGFTLVELILSIALLAIISSFSAPYYSSVYTNQQFNGATDEIISALRQAQSRTWQGYRDSGWGVYFDVGGNQYVMFKGISYAARDTNYDKINSLSSNLFLSNLSFNGGGSEIVFVRPEGTTANYGSLQLNSKNNKQVTISVNGMGMVY